MATTVPHSIQYPTYDDLVKSPNSTSELADDFRDLASSTNNALSGVEGRSKTYTDTQISNRVNTSNLALDTDGTPYFSPGSQSLRVLADTDGNPYFTDPA